jgi:transposase
MLPFAARTSGRRRVIMRSKFQVQLSDEERARLRTLIGHGVAPARLLTHARVLLKADHGDAGPGWTDAAIATALDVGLSTVARVRHRYVTDGLDAALERKAPDRQYERRLDGAQEAHLVALACSPPPEGQARWTLKLLASELVALEVVDAVSYETVRRTLKQTTSNPG